MTRVKMAGALVLAGLLAPVGVRAQQGDDLREFRIGMPVSALPAEGYAGLTCADAASQSLASWGDYKSCPAQADGSRAVGFRYAPGSPGEDDGKALVGGQPVILTLLIGADAQVAGLKIDTDPHTRLYLHKKAHLFALQVKARFGNEGWSCQQSAPTAKQQPVGGVFVHEHCEKKTASRHFILERQLFRDPAQDLRAFTDATQLTILGAG